MSKSITIMSLLKYKEFLKENKITNRNINDFKDFYVISILSPFTDDIPLKRNKNVLTLFFHDIEQEELYGMKDKDADKILKFLNKMKGDFNLIVHCTAGISRSGAVGLFASRFFKMKKSQIKGAEEINPNPFVLKKLKDAKGRFLSEIF